MTGEATVNAPLGQVWAALREPAALARAIPGCQDLAVTASLAGGTGTIETTIHAKLTENAEGATHLSYDADAEATGMLAAIGTRLLASAAARLATQFLDALSAELAPPEPSPQRSSEGQAVHPGPQCSPAGAADDPRPGTATAPTFATGVLTGVALTLAGVILARRRTRP